MYRSLIGLAMLIVVQLTLKPYPADAAIPSDGFWHKHKHHHDRRHQHEHSLNIFTHQTHSHSHFHTEPHGFTQPSLQG